jgi:hypothetical protein
MRRVVYLIDQPFDERNFQRFGIQAWIDRRWDVEVWDLTPWAHPQVWRSFMERGHHLKEFPGYFPVRSRSELMRRLHRAPTIQYLIDLAGNGLHSIRAKRALKRAGAARVVCATGSIPVPVRMDGRSPIGKLRKLIAKGPRAGWKFLGSAFLNKIVARRIPTDLAVVSGTESMPLAHNSKAVIKAHNFDYDVYLELNRSAPADEAPYAVFVDQDYCFHLEFLYQDAKFVVTAERYFPAVCNGLEAIAAALKLDMRIAAHPRASYEKRGGPQRFFRSFPMEYGRTAELVRGSKAVIGHDSTAIQYAVLFGKPIIFLTTDELSRAYEGASIESVAMELGKKPINLDRADLSAVDWRAELQVDPETYARYRSKYIKAEGSQELPLWTIVIDHVER